MYEIHVNDRPLRLRAPHREKEWTSAPHTHLEATYVGKPRTLLNYVDMLEKGSRKVTSVDIVHHDVERLWADFQSHFKLQPAAGGVVRHEVTNTHLFLFRRGWWDLPKGKIDEGETPARAALREVAEETGVTNLTLGKALPTSYHTFRSGKGKRILKPTYWFAMSTRQDELTPETAEDIELAQWRRIDTVLRSGEPLYANLRRLLEQVL